MGVCVAPGPACPSRSPAIRRMRAPPSAEDSSVRSWLVMAWYAGLAHLEGGGQVHPELDAVGAATVAREDLRRDLVVQDPGAGRHPLGVTLTDDPAATVGVVVLDDPVDHVGDGLEAPVRVPRRADRLVGGVVDRPELVEQEEGVGHVGVDVAREGSPDLEAGALHRVVGGHDLVDGSGVGLGVRGDPREDQGVLDGDSRHLDAPLIVAYASINHHPAVRMPAGG